MALVGSLAIGIDMASRRGGRRELRPGELGAPGRCGIATPCPVGLLALDLIPPLNYILSIPSTQKLFGVSTQLRSIFRALRVDRVLLMNPEFSMYGMSCHGDALAFEGLSILSCRSSVVHQQKALCLVGMRKIGSSAAGSTD
jgi:hypothetical protein